MIEKSMMKWRVKRRSSVEHEDVRRSLDILDSVLAQFDDSGDLSFSCDPSENGELEQTVISNKSSDEQFHSFPIEGTTLTNFEDQLKKYSPPPVPKRSPRTRLSYKHNKTEYSHDHPLYTNLDIVKRLKTNSTGNLNDILTASKDTPSHLSDKRLIKIWNSRDTPTKADKKLASDTQVVLLRHKRCLDSCSSCGLNMDPALERSPSVAQRRLHFESPDLRRAHRYIKKCNSSLAPIHNRIQNALSDSKLDQIGLRPEDEVEPFQSLPVSPLQKENVTWSDDISAEESFGQNRLANLNRRFAKVIRLLKTKQIVPLDYDPPDFEPPPPPIPTDMLNDDFKEVQTHQRASSDSSEEMCDRCKARALKLKEETNEEHHKSSMIDTIEDLKSLIPTDTLLRPHYGLDCSMEEDLSPGVKDILTSTPKKPLLSTFSQSTSSLGYGSSQSDQDLSFKDPVGKVPVYSLKSQTLPMGLRLVPPPPPYSPDTFMTDTESLDSCELYRSFDLSSPDRLDERSNSAPPLKHLQRAEKKSIFGMSRKEKKLKTKDDDDEISVKSSQSAEYRFRNYTSDLSTESKNMKNGNGKISPMVEDKYKRKSVWKSILRRK